MSKPKRTKANPGNTVVLVAGNGATASSNTESSITISGVGGISQSGTDGIAICGEGGNANIAIPGADGRPSQYGLAYAKGGPRGVANVNDGGIAIVRDGGKARSSNGGVSIAAAHDRHPGLAKTGNYGGIAISLLEGVVAADVGSIVIIRYLDPQQVWKFAIGYVGNPEDAPTVQPLDAGYYELDKKKKFAPLKTKKASTKV